MKATLNTDGACLGNPGPMGLGIVLEREDGVREEKSIPFGHGTNNVAEYSALIKGLEVAKEHGVTDIHVRLDSELVTRQVRGEWQVKDDKLRPLHAAAKTLLETFTTHTLRHVRREHNTRADILSKNGAERVR